MKPKTMLKLETLLQRGIRHTEEVDMPFYDVKIRIRPLSRIELNMATAEALEYIDDENTEDYFFASKEEKKGWNKSKKINLSQYLKAQNMLDLIVVKKSIEDFYSDAKLETIMKVFDVETLATKIYELSSKKEAEVDFFRKNIEGNSASDNNKKIRNRVSVNRKSD